MRTLKDLSDVSKFFNEVKKITGCTDKDIDTFLLDLLGSEDNPQDTDSSKPL
tara:strand:+ start:168 stop:323 length:156 start_codon:yes stop_codon:yes gene_type:complete